MTGSRSPHRRPRLSMPGQSRLRKKRPDPLDLRDRLGESGDLKIGKVDAQVRQSCGGQRQMRCGGEGGGLTPLDFLLGVMTDPAAAPEQRVKAAAVAARYKHPYAGESDVPSIRWWRTNSASKSTRNSPAPNATTGCASAGSGRLPFAKKVPSRRKRPSKNSSKLASAAPNGSPW